MYLLEEEVIFDELLLILLGHAFQWIEFTSEIALESFASRDDLVHDIKSLFFGDSWAEWVVFQVSAHSDPSRVDHSRLLLTKVSILKTIGFHA